MGWIRRLGLTHTKYYAQNRELVGTGYKAQEAQLGVLWWSRQVNGEVWEGGPTGKGYMYACGWFTSLYRRNSHNIVKQLYSSKENEKKKKKKACTI